MSVPLSIDITTKGGAQAKSQLDSVGRSMQQVGRQAQQTGGFMDKLSSAFSARRAMIFSLSGIVASGVEAIGMFSLLGDSQEKVSKLTAELTQMQKEGKTGTKEYADTIRELEGAQRALRFQLRLTVLSAFDLLPFTINFISSLARQRVETKLLATEQQLAAVSNQKLSASNIQLAASQRLVATSAVPLAGAMAAQNTAMAAGVAPLTNINRQLALTTPALAGATAATTTFGNAARATWLKVLGPLGLAIGAVILAVEAWKNNWGGFGDVVNSVGVQIGNQIPQLKGLLDIMVKIGETVHALISFDFGKIGEIWSGPKFTVGEKISKELEQARKEIEQFKQSASDMFSKIAAGDRGEQRDFLKLIGVTGNEKEDVKKALDAVEEVDQAISKFQASIQTAEELDLLKALGLSDVQVDEIWDDMISDLADEFKDAEKFFEEKGIGVDVFSEFIETLEKASEQGKDKGMQSILAFIDKNPDFMKYLARHSPALAKALEAMIADAGGQISQVDLADIPAEDVIRNAYEKANEKTKIINASKAIGESVLEGIKQAFTTTGANQLGLSIRTNIIDPLITGASGALNWGAGIAATILEGIMKFDFAAGLQSLNQAIGFGGDLFGNFLAGIFGFTSSTAMRMEIDNFFVNTLPLMFRVAWTNFTESLKTVFSIGNIAGAVFNVGGFINTILGGLFGTAQTITTEVINWLNLNVFDPISTQFDLTMTEIGTEILSIASVIDSGIDWITTALNSIFGTATEILTGVGQWFLDNIITPITAAWDLVVSTLTSAFSLDFLNTGDGEGDGKPLLDQILEKIFGTAEAAGPDDPKGQKVIPAIISVSATTVSADITLANLEVRIAALSLIYPAINLNPTFAGKTLTAIANTILGLANLKPEINLQSNTAGDVLTAVANTILGLENLEPQISLQNQDALDTIADTGQRIMDLEDLEPTIHVHVEAHKHFSKGDLTEGYSMAKGGVLSAARGKIATVHGQRQITVGDNVGGQESIAFIPHNDPYPIIQRILEKFGYNKSMSMYSGGTGGGHGGTGGGPEVNLVIFMDGQRMRNEIVKGIIKGQAGYR